MLWPVKDAAAEIFMTKFYQNIVEQLPGGVIDLVAALDAATTTLRSHLDTAPAIPRGRRQEVRCELPLLRDAFQASPKKGLEKPCLPYPETVERIDKLAIGKRQLTWG
jgi:CHAT domain-containing protein